MLRVFKIVISSCSPSERLVSLFCCRLLVSQSIELNFLIIFSKYHEFALPFYLTDLSILTHFCLTILVPHVRLCILIFWLPTSTSE